MPRARRRVVEGDSAFVASMASRRAMRGRCAIGPTFTRASAGSGSSKETSSSNGAEDEREERPNEGGLEKRRGRTGERDERGRERERAREWKRWETRDGVVDRERVAAAGVDEIDRERVSVLRGV